MCDSQILDQFFTLWLPPGCDMVHIHLMSLIGILHWNGQMSGQYAAKRMQEAMTMERHKVTVRRAPELPPHTLFTLEPSLYEPALLKSHALYFPSFPQE